LCNTPTRSISKLVRKKKKKKKEKIPKHGYDPRNLPRQRSPSYAPTSTVGGRLHFVHVDINTTARPGGMGVHYRRNHDVHVDLYSRCEGINSRKTTGQISVRNTLFRFYDYRSRPVNPRVRVLYNFIYIVDRKINISGIFVGLVVSYTRRYMARKR
jgi:hypothetical protein